MIGSCEFLIALLTRIASTLFEVALRANYFSTKIIVIIEIIFFAIYCCIEIILLLNIRRIIALLLLLLLLCAAATQVATATFHGLPNYHFIIIL